MKTDAEPRAVNIKPAKEKSTVKIDCAVAAIITLEKAIKCRGVTSGSVYDGR